MIYPVDAEEFLQMSQTLPLFDTRSPSEFEEGYIPLAINLPLFDDEERSKVGILYKNAGKEAATLEGLGFAGQKLQYFVKQARRHAPGRKALVHCWRGGMRSESMAWLLSTAGFEVYLLKGGYKAYRQFIRESWNKPARLIVVSGKTGSGKSEILRVIKTKGYQVLDLEKTANHKGSAFGAIGEVPQPTNEQFENNLAGQWLAFDFDKPIWLEDESRFIGKVKLPESLYMKKQSSPTLCINMPAALRIKRLVVDYASFPKELLAQSILKIQKRLGGQNAKEALEALEKNDFENAIRIVLSFYDKTYTYDVEKKTDAEIHYIDTDTEIAAANAEKMINFLDTIQHYTH